jgi:hypothetical protein
MRRSSGIAWTKSVREFSQLPRSGDAVYGFAAGLYPTDFPTLPDTDDEPVDRTAQPEA